MVKGIVLKSALNETAKELNSLVYSMATALQDVKEARKLALFSVGSSAIAIRMKNLEDKLMNATKKLSSLTTATASMAREA